MCKTSWQHLDTHQKRFYNLHNLNMAAFHDDEDEDWEAVDRKLAYPANDEKASNTEDEHGGEGRLY